MCLKKIYSTKIELVKKLTETCVLLCETKNIRIHFRGIFLKIKKKINYQKNILE